MGWDGSRRWDHRHRRASLIVAELDQHSDSSPTPCQKLFSNSPIAFVDRRVCVRRRSRIGVRDRDTTETLTANDAGAVVILEQRPFDRVVQRVIRVCISMRPTVYRDRFDIPRRIESSTGKRASDLIPDIVLERLEGSLQKIPATAAMLFLLGKTWRTRCARHMEDHWVFRRPRWVVVSNI